MEHRSPKKGGGGEPHPTSTASAGRGDGGLTPRWKIVTILMASVDLPIVWPVTTIPPLRSRGARTMMTAMVAKTTPTKVKGTLSPRPTFTLTLVGTVTDPLAGVTIMAAARMDVAGLARSGNQPSQPVPWEPAKTASFLPTNHRSKSRLRWTELCRNSSRLTPNPCVKPSRRLLTKTNHFLPSRRSYEVTGYAKRKILSRLRRWRLLNSV